MEDHRRAGRALVPVIGLRVEAHGAGTVAYSCDTEPCAAISELARGADLLVHEATGAFGGHTSNEDAARVARDAAARRLILVHLPPDVRDEQLAEARTIFTQTEFGADGARYDF
jgi:ribonuclease Z